MSLKKTLLSTLLFSLTLHAGSIGININSEDVEVQGSANLNSTLGMTGSTTYLFDAQYLHTKHANMTTVGISGENSLEAAQGLTLGFGMKAAFADNFFALPFMAKATFTLPFDSDIPTTSLKAYFAYAPSVLTFIDGESYSEFRTEADMEVISNIHIFAGYRNIDTNYDHKDYNYNDSFYGGLKLSF